MNFSNSMNTVGQSVTNSFNVKLQPEQFERGYLTNKFKENSAAYETDGFYRSRAPKSVDFHGKTMYGKMGDFGRSGYGKIGGIGNGGFGQTGIGNAGFGQTGIGNAGYGQTGTGYGQTGGFGNGGFSKTGYSQSGVSQGLSLVGSEYNRYVPRHVNSSVFDFYQ